MVLIYIIKQLYVKKYLFHILVVNRNFIFFYRNFKIKLASNQRKYNKITYKRGGEWDYKTLIHLKIRVNLNVVLSFPYKTLVSASFLFRSLSLSFARSCWSRRVRHSLHLVFNCFSRFAYSPFSLFNFFIA